MAAIRLILSILALATIVLSQDPEAVDAWTLFNSSITCGASCKYDFFVRKLNSGEEFHCNFEKPGKPDPNVFITEETCHAEPLRTVSLTWQIDGSVLFSITDIDKKTVAFYALDSWEIHDGSIAPDKTEWAWQNGQLTSPEMPPTVVPDFDYGE
ncbi:hypothetical protein F5Y13DRAFT_187494 [Hypoxylon sp. FL1857]|nr:hypothetical protein F5Y13DRAFT_187494 [Hypoxylon sp. FL1857]